MIDLLIFLLLISVIIFVVYKIRQMNDFRVYTIKKGKHTSGLRFGVLTYDELTFKTKFDKSAKYTSIDPINQYDINKLYGFSDCNQHHHKNSARFGWRWLNGGVEIHAYVYNNGVRHSELITLVNIGELHDYKILIEEDKYIFSVDDNVIEMNRTNRCEHGLYYMLSPYFGGDEVAPHDISIMIKK